MAMTSEGPADGLLASQWYDRWSDCVTDAPERRLLLAVLVDVIRCLQRGNEKERRDAAAWVHGKNGNARLLFRSLCDGLGLEVAPLERRLLALAADGKPIVQRRARGSATLRIGRRVRQPPKRVEKPAGGDRAATAAAGFP
jgi:hypothetical protein